MARPTFEPTTEQRDMVEQLTAFGIPQSDIVNVIKDKNGKPITDRTLRKHFRQELDGGAVKANLKVAKALFKNATTATDVYPGGNPTSQIFWMKTRGGWKETPKPLEISGKDGGPIEQANVTPIEFRKIAQQIVDDV